MTNEQKLLRCNSCGYIGGAGHFITAGDPNDPVRICPQCREMEILGWAGKRETTISIDLLFLLLGMTEKCYRYDTRHERETGQKPFGWDSHYVLTELYDFLKAEGLLLSSEEEES